MDINYKGQWGYHPLIISLNNTGEPLYLVNRSGNRPSHEGATRRFNSAIDLCLGAGFKRVLLRGDTDFTQTKALDDWHGRGVQFIFGIDATKNLVEMAESLENKAFKPLTRKPKYTVKTQPRRRPRNIKEAIVKEREFENLRLRSEEVAEFDPDVHRDAGQLLSKLSHGGGSQEPHGRAWRVGVVRRRALLLLHNQHSQQDVREHCEVGQWPLQSGKTDRSAQGRRSSAGHAGGQPGESRRAGRRTW